MARGRGVFFGLLQLAFFSRREREKSFPDGEGRLSPFGRREKVCSSFFLVVWGCFFLSAGKGGFFWSERVGIVGVSCILSSLVFHSGFLSISIPFIIASQAAHVPVGKGSPYGRTGRLLVSFSLPLSSSFSSFTCFSSLAVFFLFCIPPCRDVVWRVGMRVWTLWSYGSGMAKEL